MKNWMSAVNWRAGLMTLIAAFAIMLLGADFPGHETDGASALSTAQELCKDLPSDMQPEMEKISAQSPHWVLQAICD